MNNAQSTQPASTLRRALDKRDAQPHAYLAAYWELTVIYPKNEGDPVLIYVRNHTRWSNLESKWVTLSLFECPDGADDIQISAQEIISKGRAIADRLRHNVSIIHCFGKSQQVEHQFTPSSIH